jgi:hypothetical protein
MPACRRSGGPEGRSCRRRQAGGQLGSAALTTIPPAKAAVPHHVRVSDRLKPGTTNRPSLAGTGGPINRRMTNSVSEIHHTGMAMAGQAAQIMRAHRACDSVRRAGHITYDDVYPDIPRMTSVSGLNDALRSVVRQPEGRFGPSRRTESHALTVQSSICLKNGQKLSSGPARGPRQPRSLPGSRAGESRDGWTSRRPKRS